MFIIFILAVILIAYFMLGMIAGGDMSPIPLTPLFIFFIVCIYKAKEERATARMLLKQVNEKLEKTEKELEEIKSLLKKENTDEQNSEEDSESDEENQE